jgi:hypothetical protein
MSDNDIETIIRSVRECGTADAVHIVTMLSLVCKELRDLRRELEKQK